MVDLNDWHRDQTHKIQELKILLDNGELALDEYNELCQDVIDIGHILEEIRTEQDMINAQKIVEGLKVLAGLL
tara:strand:- start:1862 stop:2080 length:219 start_codon:yes stop_codon:yes gene_type:complete